MYYIFKSVNFTIFNLFLYLLVTRSSIALCKSVVKCNGYCFKNDACGHMSPDVKNFKLGGASTKDIYIKYGHVRHFKNY